MIFVYVELKILVYMPFLVTNHYFSGSEAVKSSFCFTTIEIHLDRRARRDALGIKTLEAFYMISE